MNSVLDAKIIKFPSDHQRKENKPLIAPTPRTIEHEGGGVKMIKITPTGLRMPVHAFTDLLKSIGFNALIKLTHNIVIK